MLKLNVKPCALLGLRVILIGQKFDRLGQRVKRCHFVRLSHLNKAMINLEELDGDCLYPCMPFT